MNQTVRRCHEVEGVPLLVVDAFRTHRARIADRRTTFVLTHYHGDHFSGLPRDGSYQGPAMIHCTHVTAELLVSVHGVPPRFVAGHGYGEVWTVPISAVDDGVNGYDGEDGGRKYDDDDDDDECVVADRDEKVSKGDVAEVTFLDANHCPGAALVFVRLPDGRCHLHTGDMRYCPAMRQYGPLREAALGRTLDVLYLDTTYGHPRHDFESQDVAMKTIASATAEQLSMEMEMESEKEKEKMADTRERSGGEAAVDSDGGDGTSGAPSNESPRTSAAGATLILLSCYSIGKEKVLREVYKRTGSLIYANEKKRTMLKCVEAGNRRADGIGDCEGNDDDVGGGCGCGCAAINVSSCITDDPARSDVHIIPMGMAGELWPFFRPNFIACAEYALSQRRAYGRVVAYLPTGWADASKWNKKNAVSRKRVDVNEVRRNRRNAVIVDVRKKGGEEGETIVNNDRSRTEDNVCDASIDVEIRLVPYSEHSTYSELRTFVEFLRPRRIVPTVFSDEKGYVALEKRFNDLVDDKRAKLNFFSSMSKLQTDAESNKTGRLAKRTFCIRSGVKHDNDERGSAKRLKATVSCQVPPPIDLGDCGAVTSAETVRVPSQAYTNNGNTETHGVKVVKNLHNISSTATSGDCTADRAIVLTSMGFTSTACLSALKKSGGDIEQAVELLLSSGPPSAGKVSPELGKSKDPSTPRPTARQSKCVSNGDNRISTTKTITQFFRPKGA